MSPSIIKTILTVLGIVAAALPQAMQVSPLVAQLLVFASGGLLAGAHVQRPGDVAK